MSKFKTQPHMHKLAPSVTESSPPEPEMDPAAKLLQDPTGNKGLMAPGKTRATGVRAKLTQFEIAERRRKVMRLRLRGLSIPQIAKLIGSTEFTTERDLKAIQEANAQQVDKFKQNQFVGESLAVFGELEERAWGEFSSLPEGAPGRLKVLDLVRTLQNDKLKALLDTGIIRKDEAPAVVEHHHTLEWTDAVKQTVTRAMLESALKTPLAEPTASPDEGAPVESVVPADGPPDPPNTLDFETEEDGDVEAPDLPEGDETE